MKKGFVDDCVVVTMRHRSLFSPFLRSNGPLNSPFDRD